MLARIRVRDANDKKVDELLEKITPELLELADEYQAYCWTLLHGAAGYRSSLVNDLLTETSFSVEDELQACGDLPKNRYGVNFRPVRSGAAPEVQRLAPALGVELGCLRTPRSQEAWSISKLEEHRKKLSDLTKDSAPTVLGGAKDSLGKTPGGRDLAGTISAVSVAFCRDLALPPWISNRVEEMSSQAGSRDVPTRPMARTSDDGCGRTDVDIF